MIYREKLAMNITVKTTEKESTLNLFSNNVIMRSMNAITAEFKNRCGFSSVVRNLTIFFNYILH